MCCVVVQQLWSERYFAINAISRRIVFMSSLQEENFHWNVNFAILLLANSLKLSFAYYYIFRNLQRQFIWLKFKNQNSLIFNLMYFTNLSQVAKLNYVYMYIFISSRRVLLSIITDNPNRIPYLLATYHSMVNFEQTSSQLCHILWDRSVWEIVIMIIMSYQTTTDKTIKTLLEI